MYHVPPHVKLVYKEGVVCSSFQQQADPCFYSLGKFVFLHTPTGVHHSVVELHSSICTLWSADCYPKLYLRTWCIVYPTSKTLFCFIVPRKTFNLPSKIGTSFTPRRFPGILTVFCKTKLIHCHHQFLLIHLDHSPCQMLYACR